MRSKQINFFTAPEDIIEISEFLKAKGCYIFKNNLESINQLEEYNIVSNTDEIFQVCLTNKEFVNKIEFEFVESKNYYYIDILKSYVVQFNIGGFYPYSQKELHSGRLYYIFEYYGDNDDVIQKDKNFISWADLFIKEFKASYLHKDVSISKNFVSDKFIEWKKVHNAIESVDGTKVIVQ